MAKVFHRFLNNPLANFLLFSDFTSHMSLSSSGSIMSPVSVEIKMKIRIFFMQTIKFS